MKRIFYKIISPVRRLYWFVFRPKTYGVKTLVKFGNKFLFIRNTYGIGHWTIPGGGKGKNESPEEAARRETLEEVGIALPKLAYLGEYSSRRQHKRDTVYCFYAEAPSAKFKIDPGEIKEAQWFEIDNIPSFRSKAVEEIINLYKRS